MTREAGLAGLVEKGVVARSEGAHGPFRRPQPFQSTGNSSWKTDRRRRVTGEAAF